MPAPFEPRSAVAAAAHAAATACAAVFLVVCVAQLPLILNPGYFSHDELQWAARADVAAGQALPWFSWTALAEYQYRPLTFNLWLWLSRHVFDQPYAFHAICIAWGAANAALLARIGMGFGMRARTAALGALAFALGPYAVYVHGWVGTLGDLIWLSCALLIAAILQRPRAQGAAVAAVVSAALTAVGLLGKEAAIAIPPLLAAAWLFDDRKRVWLAATAASGAVVAAYLTLRFDALTGGAPQGEQYALSALHPPLRWLEYQLFAQMPHVLETFTTLGADWTPRKAAAVGAAALLWAALVAALWRAGPRYALLFLVGGVAALAAVLPLARSWNHYGYAFAAVAAMSVAAAWPRAPRWGRGVIAVVALLNLAHGAVVMAAMHRVGQAQAVFSPALIDALGAHPDAALLRLRPAPDSREWIFLRLTHEIPSYRGVAIGERVRVVARDAPADYQIEPDGSLTPLR